jgi:hypothetical protein
MIGHELTNGFSERIDRAMVFVLVWLIESRNSEIDQDNAVTSRR